MYRQAIKLTHARGPNAVWGGKWRNRLYARAWSHAEFAELLLQQGKTEGAQSAYRNAMKHVRSYAEPYERLADLLREEGRACGSDSGLPRS